MQDRLSSDQLQTIFSNLEYTDIASLALVCRSLHTASEDPVVWARLFKRDLSCLDFNQDNPKLSYKSKFFADKEVCVAYYLSELLLTSRQTRLCEDDQQEMEEKSNDTASATLVTRDLLRSDIIRDIADEKKSLQQILLSSRQKFLKKVDLLSNEVSKQELEQLKSEAYKKAEILHTIPQHLPQTEQERIDIYSRLMEFFDVLCLCDAYAHLSRLSDKLIHNFAVFHKSCLYSRTNIVKMLAEKISDVNQLAWIVLNETRSKVTPLGAAIIFPLMTDTHFSAAKDVIDFLLSRGANPDAPFFTTAASVEMDDKLADFLAEITSRPLREFCVNVRSSNYRNPLRDAMLDSIIKADIVEEIEYESGKIVRFNY